MALQDTVATLNRQIRDRQEQGLRVDIEVKETGYLGVEPAKQIEVRVWKQVSGD